MLHASSKDLRSPLAGSLNTWCSNQHRSDADKVAFALHATLLSAGFRLLAVGDPLTPGKSGGVRLNKGLDQQKRRVQERRLMGRCGGRGDVTLGCDTTV